MKRTARWLLPLVATAGAAAWTFARLSSPSRRYDGAASVSHEYDRWTDERILEYYWGEHIHLGHYGDPPVRKPFLAAKVDFIDEFFAWGVAAGSPALAARLAGAADPAAPVRILDAGCGIGGSARHLARTFRGRAHVTGVTISRAQIRRAAELTDASLAPYVAFREADVMQLPFADASFDLVWALESEPHMPDKRRFVQELVRVLAPGGTLVLATWNTRDPAERPFSAAESAELQYLYDEWCHPHFLSIPAFETLLREAGLSSVAAADWSTATIPSWRDSVAAGLRDPRGLLRAKPQQVGRLLRDAYTVLRMDAAFRKGLCRYGVLRGVKPA